ncbi:MAG: pilin [Candidatus Shapirobacteria bacterium]|nr:pilin [Candidatus Shapirobacteria bacterium]MDD4410199.1 pilin [Candidatus Shapirobacteria bacterium]
MNLLSNILSPSPVYAQDAWNSTCYNLDSNGDKIANIQGFECIFANIAQVIVYFAGIAFFIMLLKGGFLYLTSGGDPKKTAKATSTLTTSVIGLVGVILSFLIIKFIGNFTGVNVFDFIIPSSSTTHTSSSGVIHGGGGRGF